MATVYEHIEQNKRRTWLLVLLFPLTFALFTYLALAGVFYLTDSASQPDERGRAAYEDAYYGQNYPSSVYTGEPDTLTKINVWALYAIPVCWALAMMWVLISYYSGDQLLLRSAHAIPIEKKDQPEIYRLVENIAITRGLPVPKVYIMNDNSLNAFATGRDPQHASVALTKGIVQKLDRAELEGVIAHEMAHVENRDIRLMLITVAGISFFTLVGEILFRSALAARRGNGKNGAQAQLVLMLLGLVFLVYGYVIAPLIRLAVSRTREFLADATAALTTRNPAALASALRKISSDSRVESLADHASMAAMCIANPLKKQNLFASLSNLTATHPPVEDRIRALMEMDGRLPEY